jgi:hypothetical protein
MDPDPPRDNGDDDLLQGDDKRKKSKKNKKEKSSRKSSRSAPGTPVVVDDDDTNAMTAAVAAMSSPTPSVPSRRDSSRKPDASMEAKRSAVSPRQQTDSLNQMEQDVLAKTRAASGGGSVGGTRNSALDQLEADILTKNQGRPTGSSMVGAQAVSGTQGTKQDAKASGRSPGVGAQAVSGAQGAQQDAKPSGRSAATGGARNSALTQLEADVVTKYQARGGSSVSSRGSNSMVGAQSVGPQGSQQDAKPSGRSAKESNAQRVAAGAQPTMGGSQNQGKQRPTPSLRDLERDIAAKTRGANNDQQRSSLQNMEDDVVAKTRARSSVGTSARMESQRSSLQNMEDEVVAKRRAQRPSTTSVATAAVAGTATATVTKIGSTPPPPGDSKTGSYDEYQRGASAVAAVVSYPDEEKLKAASYPPPANSGVNGFGDATIYGQSESGTPPTPMPLTQHFPSDAPEMAPHVQNMQFSSSGEPPTAGIEAFVADHAVVDATGVAVVLSEAEEERLDRKRARRYTMYGSLGFLIIAGGIIAAIVLTVGKPDPVEPMVPTSTPSMSPSMVPSVAPTTSRLDDWIELLTPTSEDAILTNRSSAQYQAALWIADEDELRLPVGSVRGLQRYILAVFYFATTGDGWEECGRLDPTCGGDPDDRSWLLNDEHECIWKGVGCDITGTVVTSIFFARQLGNNLIGTLPQELADLTDLGSLILQRNQLTGSLPAFLGKLKKLRVLFLLGNMFDGSIPEELLTGSPMLGTIHFGENQLTGTIPTVFGSLSMKTLNLYDNLLVGSIPTELGELSLMSKLFVYGGNGF